MAFGTYQSSRRRGRPVDLFLFTYGPDPADYYAYTDHEQQIVFGGITYIPATIGRDGIKASGTLDKSQMTVSTSVDTEVAELFRVYPPSRIVTLVIREGHLNDPDADYPVIWAGRVLSCSRDDGEAALTCEPISTSMRRAMLRRNYQYGCPLVLYGRGCKADKEAAKVTAVVVDATGTTLTLPPDWTTVDLKPKFRAGYLEWTGADGRKEIRTILAVDTGTDQLRVSGLLRDLDPGANVDLFLGCNHLMTDCKDLHNNILNFGGCPWIPTKSPFGTTNNYY